MKKNQLTRNAFLLTIALNIMLSAMAQNVGINTNTPTTALDVNGGLRVRGGAPGLGKILVGTDANGHTTWKNTRVAFRAKGIQGGGLQNIA